MLFECSLRIRYHHMVKTFWGWRDQQLPDGTVILTSASGKTYVTTPGSALLFPSLCVPTGDVPAPQPSTAVEYCGDRTSMMPRRTRTRLQDRAQCVAAERRQNHQARTIRLRYSSPACACPPVMWRQNSTVQLTTEVRGTGLT